MSAPTTLVTSVWKYLAKHPDLVVKVGIAAGKNGLRFVNDFKSGTAKPSAVPRDVTAAFFKNRRDELMKQLEANQKALKKHDELEAAWRASNF